MALMKFETLVVLAMMAYLVTAHGGMHDMKNWKCKPNKEQRDMHDKIFSTCYQEVTKKELPEGESKQVWKDLSEDEHTQLFDCARKSFHSEMHKPDGTIDVDKIKEEINNMETDDTTKKALIDGIGECIAAGTESETFDKCKKDLFMKECKAEPEEQLA